MSLKLLLLLFDMVIKRKLQGFFFQRNRNEDGNSKQKVFRNDVSTHYSNELKETVSKRCYRYVYLHLFCSYREIVMLMKAPWQKTSP